MGKEFTDQQEQHNKNKQDEQKKETEIIEEVEEEEEKEPEPEGPIQYPIAPKYKLVHSYPVDIGEFWNDQEIHQVLKNPRPKELVITIQVPLVESAKNLICDVKNKSLVLEYL